MCIRCLHIFPVRDAFGGLQQLDVDMQRTDIPQSHTARYSLSFSTTTPEYSINIFSSAVSFGVREETPSGVFTRPFSLSRTRSPTRVHCSRSKGENSSKRLTRILIVCSESNTTSAATAEEGKQSVTWTTGNSGCALLILLAILSPDVFME